MAASPLWSIFCLGLLIKASEGQPCIRGESGDGLPAFRDYSKDHDRIDDSRIIRHHQAIIPSYQFECSDQMCGNITAWGVDVRRDGANSQPGGGTPYTLDLQVWRPSPTVDDSTGTGCYSLVGSNRFTSISLSNGVAQFLVPPSSNYIMFRPGDVLGVYVEVARNADDGVVILTTSRDISTFTRESVWFASIAPTMATSQNGDCPYSVGSNGGVLNTMTTGAPVIATATFPCPSLPPTATTQPTPPPPNPTTESEETPPTTNQQTQEPVDPPTTSDRPATDTEGATGTEPKVPTTSKTATDLPILSPSESNDVVIGIVVVILVVIASAVTVVVIIAILLKRRHVKMTTVVAVPTTTNQAYGLNTHYDKEMEEELYSYPEVGHAIKTKENEAYVTTTDITTKGNQAYALCANIDPITTERNQAYATTTSIITEQNQAYATNITNAASDHS